MNKTLLFKDVEDISDFKNVLKENIDYISHRTNGFINPESLELALTGLKNFPQEQEKSFITFVKKVDKAFVSRGSYNGNAFHKFPIVIAGSIFYNYYPETISELTLDEIVLLSNFSFVEAPEYYETAVEKYGKEMLSSIIEKTKNDNSDNLSIFMLADKMMKVDGKTREETLEYIKQTSKEQLLKEEEQYTIEMFKHVHIPW